VGKYIVLPASHGCFGRSKMRIHLHDPASDPLDKIFVGLKSGAVHRRAKLKRHGSTVTATLDLRGLSGSFKVTVRVTTVLGTQISRKRTYRLCGAPPRHRAHHPAHH
jgi:hypothetical protein